MAHDNHVVDGVNKDAGLDLDIDFVNPFPPTKHMVVDGVDVISDHHLVGSKARFGAYFMSRVVEKEIVYVQPRFGLAGLSIIELARVYDKRVTLFMPSSKRISEHQACCIERGAKPVFRRIAAMPNLNLMAKRYAEENGALFVPLGLHHPDVVRGAVHAIREAIEGHGLQPRRVVCACSTGVLSRSLQLAIPNAEHVAVCVARNMKAGELGVATPISYPLRFEQPAATRLPPFPSVVNYDAKAWGYTRPGDLFWNVGADPILRDRTIIANTDSYRDWREER